MSIKKKIAKLWISSIAISSLAIFSTNFVNAVENTCFIFDSNTKSITWYSFDESCQKDITIPVQINWVDVEKIGWSSFMSQWITSLQFAEWSKVQEIFWSAFAWNKIKHLVTPSSLKHIYWNWAFSWNPFESITLNEWLLTLWQEAFTWAPTEFMLNWTINVPSTVTSIQNRPYHEVRRWNIPLEVSQRTNIYQEWDILYRIEGWFAYVMQVTNPDWTHIPNKVTLWWQEYEVNIYNDLNVVWLLWAMYNWETWASRAKKENDQERIKNLRKTSNLTIAPEVSERSWYYVSDWLLLKRYQERWAFQDHFTIMTSTQRENRSLNLPTTFMWMPIKEIFVWAFEWNTFNWTEITIPEWYEKISWRSFNSTNLTKINLPTTLTDLDKQFAQWSVIEEITHKWKTNVIEIDWQKVVKLIEWSLYRLSEDETHWIMIWNPNENKQTIQNEIEWKPVKVIADRVFNHRYLLEDLHIPDNIEVLEDSVFYNSWIRNITGWKWLKEVRHWVFLGWRIREFTIPMWAIEKMWNAVFVSNSWEKFTDYKVALIVENESEKQRIQWVIQASWHSEEEINVKVVTKEEAKVFDRTPPDYDLVRWTWPDNNLVKINWKDYKDEKALYKIVDQWETCATNTTQANWLWYSTTIHNIFLKKEDSNKKLCVVGYDTSWNETVKEMNIWEVRNDNINVGLKEIWEAKLDWRVKEIGTTKAIVLDNDRVMLFQTVSNETCDVFGSWNNQGCDRPEVESDKTTMRRDENILIYTRSTWELTRINDVVNNTGIDNIGITQDSIFVHDKEKNRIIAMGGYHFTKENGNADNTAPLLGKVRQYDIATKTWSLLPDISPIWEEGGQAADTVGFLHWREIFYAYHKPVGVSKMHVYNIDTWKVRTLTLSENVPFHSSSQFVINNELYTGGWFTGVVGANSTYSNKFRKIDLSTGKVTNLPDMLSRREDAASVLIGNRMYLIGWAIQSEVDWIQIRETAKDIEYFDLETQTWHKANQELSKEVSYGYPVNLNGEVLIIGGILWEGVNVLDNYNTKLFKEVSNSDGTTRKTFVDKLDWTTKKIERHYSQSPKIFALTINNSPEFDNADSNTTLNLMNWKKEISFTFNWAFDDWLENWNRVNQKIYWEYSKDGWNTWLRCWNNTFDAWTKTNYTCHPALSSDRNYWENLREWDKVLVRLNDWINQSESQEVTIKKFEVVINAPDTKEVFIWTAKVDSILDWVTINDWVWTKDDLTILWQFDPSKVWIYNITLSYTDEFWDTVTKDMTITVKEADKTTLINKLKEWNDKLNDKQVISDENRKKLEDRIKEIEAQDKTNLTSKEIWDLVNELTSLIDKLNKDTTVPVIVEKLWNLEVSADITDDNLDKDQIFYYKNDSTEKIKYVPWDKIKIDNTWNKITFEATDKYWNKWTKVIDDIYNKTKPNTWNTSWSSWSSSGPGWYYAPVNSWNTNSTYWNSVNNNWTITPSINWQNNNWNNSTSKVSMKIVDQLWNEIQPTIVKTWNIWDFYDFSSNVPDIDWYQLIRSNWITWKIWETDNVELVFQRLSDLHNNEITNVDIVENWNSMDNNKQVIPEWTKNVRLPKTWSEVAETDNKTFLTMILWILAMIWTSVVYMFKRR